MSQLKLQQDSIYLVMHMQHVRRPIKLWLFLTSAIPTKELSAVLAAALSLSLTCTIAWCQIIPALPMTGNRAALMAGPIRSDSSIIMAQLRSGCRE